MKYLHYKWLILSALLFAAGCDQYCEQPTQTAIVFGFYTAADSAKGNRNGVVFQALQLDSTMNNVGSDAQVALCPLNPATDTTAFVLTKAETVDTLTIVYTRRPAFISEECGCVGFADVEDVKTTNHFIKGIELVNSKVGQVIYRPNVINAENIRIYY